MMELLGGLIGGLFGAGVAIYISHRKQARDQSYWMGEVNARLKHLEERLSRVEDALNGLRRDG